LAERTREKRRRGKVPVFVKRKNFRIGPREIEGTPPRKGRKNSMWFEWAKGGRGGPSL